MRTGRLPLAVLASLLLLAILAAWLVPERLDWNRFRPEIERLSSVQLGREVRIEGPISLTLLPQPVITASAITLAGPAPIRADALRLRIGLGALLGGQIEAREMVLRGVDMRIPWPLPASSYPVRAPTWLAAVSARIEQGRVAVGDLTFTGIEATLTTGTISGSYAAAGTGQLYGKTWRFTARLTPPGGDGSAALDATLDGQGSAQGIGASLSGQLGANGDFGGRVTARGPDLSQLMPAPAVAFSAGGRVTVADGLAAADDLALDIGGSPIKAAVALRVAPTPRLDVAIAASRIDLDAWLPPLSRGQTTELPLGIDISAEAAQLAGGTLRRLRGAIDLSGTDAKIRELSVILPGEANLTLTGHAMRGPAFGLEADMTLAAPRLRTTLAWLDGALTVLGASPGPAAVMPAEVLREAVLKGRVSLTAERLSATALAGKLDLAPVAGDAVVTFGRRPAIRARLSFDDLPLDPWLVDGAFNPGAADIDISIDARAARWHGRTLSPLHLEAAMEPGRMTIRALRLQSNGIRASIAGTLVAGGRIADGALDLTAGDGTQLLALFPETFAAIAASSPLMLRLPVHARANLAGPARALAARLALEIGDLRIAAEPTIDLPGRAWTGVLTLRHPGAPRLAELLGIGGAPAWLGDGSLAVVAQTAGDDAKWTANSFDLAAGSLHATGQLTLDTTGAGGERRLTGQIQAETLPLPLPYARSPEPLPIPSLAGWQASIAIQARSLLLSASPALEQASANLVIADGVARLQSLKARLGGGELTGSVSLDTAREPRRLEASLALSDASIGGPLFGLPLDLTSGIIGGRASFGATGSSPAGLLATLAGSLKLDARAGTLAGIDLARATGDLLDDAVRASLAGGSTRFDHLVLDATVDHGQMNLDRALLDAPAGQISITGAIDLPNASAALHLAARPAVAAPPDIGLTLTGPLASPRRTPELAGAALWRVARAAPEVSPAQVAPGP